VKIKLFKTIVMQPILATASKYILTKGRSQ